MAYMNTTRTAPATILDRFTSAMIAVKAAYKRRRIYDQTLRELSALSDRDLDDLGMHRTMISEIAHQAAFGK